MKHHAVESCRVLADIGCQSRQVGAARKDAFHILIANPHGSEAPPVRPSAVEVSISKAHFAYVEEHSDTIVLAGGSRPDVGQPFCGALWIVEAADRAEAVRLIEDDPYRRFDIWSAPDVYAWGRAPFYKCVQL